MLWRTAALESAGLLGGRSPQSRGCGRLLIALALTFVVLVIFGIGERGRRSPCGQRPRWSFLLFWSHMLSAIAWLFRPPLGGLARHGRELGLASLRPNLFMSGSSFGSFTSQRDASEPWCSSGSTYFAPKIDEIPNSSADFAGNSAPCSVSSRDDVIPGANKFLCNGTVARRNSTGVIATSAEAESNRRGHKTEAPATTSHQNAAHALRRCSGEGTGLPSSIAAYHFAGRCDRKARYKVDESWNFMTW